uniref:Conserved protein n=1 Tax=Panagrellus redivivus TaxID=6233 RepID=A0A7E4W8Y6_PANRE
MPAISISSLGSADLFGAASTSSPPPPSDSGHRRRQRPHSTTPAGIDNTLDYDAAAAAFFGENNHSIPYQMHRTSLDEKLKTQFTGGGLSRPNGVNNASSLAGVFVLIFVLIGIIMVLMLFYFLAKVCNGSDREKKTPNGTIIVKHPGFGEIEVVQSRVAYPKRIYELKAEEGYFSCPPSLTPSLADVFGSDEDEETNIFDPPAEIISSAPATPSAADAPEFTDPEKHTSAESLPQHRPVAAYVELDNSRFTTKHKTPTAEQLNAMRKLTPAGLPPGFKPKGRLQELANGSF